MYPDSCVTCCHVIPLGCKLPLTLEINGLQEVVVTDVSHWLSISPPQTSVHYPTLHFANTPCCPKMQGI